ncbi:hypothetical protein KM043_017831 [Ampulex compressa]|nr:hypothetical protein KM043_017831 [Ampulex compressa]
MNDGEAGGEDGTRVSEVDKEEQARRSLDLPHGAQERSSVYRLNRSRGTVPQCREIFHREGVRSAEGRGGRREAKAEEEKEEEERRRCGSKRRK